LVLVDKDEGRHIVVAFLFANVQDSTQL